MTDRTRRELLNLQEELPQAVKDCEKSVLEDNPDLSKSEAIAICRDQLDMEAADDDCPEGEVQVGERCIDITTVEDVPPSSLDMSAHRILANRRLAGPIERDEVGESEVVYRNLKVITEGVWTDAGSEEPTHYDPAELEVADDAAVNVMHDDESESSQAGQVLADSYYVEDGDGYVDVQLNTDTPGGQFADASIKESLETDGQAGVDGPSIEIPAEGYDLEEEGPLGYPRLINGTINGLGFVGLGHSPGPAAKDTDFRQQTAERNVAMSAADSPNPMVYLRKDGGMSEEIRNAVLARELQVDEIQDDAQAIADELDVPVGEVMEVLDPLLDMEEGDENGDDEGPPDDDGEDVENEDKPEDYDEDEEEDKENEGDVEEEIQALWDELEALKDGMMAEEDAQDLADADEVAELREEKQALADDNEELEKRLEALEDEPTDPKSLADDDGEDLEPVWDNTPSQLSGW